MGSMMKTNQKVNQMSDTSIRAYILFAAIGALLGYLLAVNI
jgi:hypothetical protein